MRKIIQEKLYFVFRDSDGILGFTIRCYEGEPVNPRFLFDGDKQVFLLHGKAFDILLECCYFGKRRYTTFGCIDLNFKIMTRRGD